MVSMSVKASLVIALWLFLLTGCSSPSTMDFQIPDAPLHEINRLEFQPQATQNFNLTLPFNAGETWYVCHGYMDAPGQDLQSHRDRHSLDLTPDPNSEGNTGCWGDTNAATGREILAPASGRIYHLDRNPDMVCLDLNQGGSMAIGHFSDYQADGTPVTQNQVLGHVDAPNRKNGGFAHIHVDFSFESRCAVGRQSVPFSDQFGTRFREAPNLPDKGGFNQWSGEQLTRTSTLPLDNSLIQATGESEVYWFQNGKKYHVLNPSVLNKMVGVPSWDWSLIRNYSATVINGIQNGPKFVFPLGLCPFSPSIACSDGLLIRQAGEERIYLMDRGKSRWIVSANVFENAGFAWADVVSVSKKILNSIPLGDDFIGGTGGGPPTNQPPTNPTSGGIRYGSSTFGGQTISLHQDSGRRLYFSGASQWCSAIQGQAFGQGLSDPISGSMSGDRCIVDFSSVASGNNIIFFKHGSAFMWVDASVGDTSGGLTVIKDSNSGTLNVRIPNSSTSNPPPTNPPPTNPNPASGGIRYGSSTFGGQTILLHQDSGRRLYFSGASQWCSAIQGQAFGQGLSDPIGGSMSGDRCIVDFSSAASGNNIVFFKHGSAFMWVEASEGDTSGGLTVIKDSNSGTLNVRIPNSSTNNPPPTNPPPTNPTGGGIQYGSSTFGGQTISLHQDSGRKLYFTEASQWCSAIQGQAFGQGLSDPISGSMSGDRCIVDFSSAASGNNTIFFKHGNAFMWVEASVGDTSGGLTVIEDPNSGTLNVRVP